MIYKMIGTCTSFQIFAISRLLQRIHFATSSAISSNFMRSSNFCKIHQTFRTFLSRLSSKFRDFDESDIEHANFRILYLMILQIFRKSNANSSVPLPSRTACAATAAAAAAGAREEPGRSLLPPARLPRCNPLSTSPAPAVHPAAARPFEPEVVQRWSLAGISASCRRISLHQLRGHSN